MTETPNANRLHIAIFGKRNSGKSSLINAVTNQPTALVSDEPGTTTDPVFKAMEINPLGPCVLIDTAGFDDTGELGALRVEATKKIMDKTDVALILFTDADFEKEKQWLDMLKQRGIPVLAVVSKADIIDGEKLSRQILKELRLKPHIVSSSDRTGIDGLKERIARIIPEDFEIKSITGHIVSENDIVLLVMPQDIQAPKGRLILPQVQVIRDLLDNKCIVMSVTEDNLLLAIDSLKNPPKVIITDSQVFKTVYRHKPVQSILTSFSVLFSRYKGDIGTMKEGADAISALKDGDRVLIAEACTHASMDGDIAREKLPAMLRAAAGEGLKIDIVSGVDFPKDLSPYSLVIHCGGCMFNRRYVMSRINAAAEQGVPITNYGIAIARLSGILDKIVL